MGCLGRVYGVKGWLKVISNTDPIDNILNYPVWQLYHQGQWQSNQIESGKKHGQGLIVKLSLINDREQAQQYVNDAIAVQRDELPLIAEEEYYWADLIGLKVATTSGVDLGRIDSMLATGANDVMVVKGAARHLIPYIDPVIRSIDLEDQLIVVEWGSEDGRQKTEDRK